MFVGNGKNSTNSISKALGVFILLLLVEENKKWVLMGLICPCM